MESSPGFHRHTLGTSTLSEVALPCRSLGVQPPKHKKGRIFYSQQQLLRFMNVPMLTLQYIFIRWAQDQNSLAKGCMVNIVTFTEQSSSYLCLFYHSHQCLNLFLKWLFASSTSSYLQLCNSLVLCRNLRQFLRFLHFFWPPIATGKQQRQLRQITHLYSFLALHL